MLKKQLTSMALVIELGASTATATFETADARNRGVAIGAGVAAGIIGLGIIGSAA